MKFWIKSGLSEYLLAMYENTVTTNQNKLQFGIRPLCQKSEPVS